MYDIDLNAIVKNTQRLKLLYVEDLKDAREVVLEFLELFFDDISIAVDGEDAWNQYSVGKFDVVLTDINMPNLNGLELSKKIREIDNEVAILVLSAYDKTEYLLDSIKHGIDAYLIKPFDMEQFLTGISKVIKKIQNQKKLKAYTSKLQDMLNEKSKTTNDVEINVEKFNTKLPNYIMLQEDLSSGKFNYMLLLDMSHFESLQKEYGREFISHVITRTAHILEKLIHKKAKLYKIEAYKFVILLKDAKLTNVHFYCEQIGMFFDTKNVAVDDSELHIRFKIGVDVVRDDISQTFINCECALDVAINSTSKHYAIYDENSSLCHNKEEATHKLRLTRELIVDKKIKPYFQPIKNVLNQNIEMYETFARGVLDAEVILPIYFIESAKKLGLSSEITKLMINKSFKFFKNSSDNFSINLTEADLMDSYLIEFLQNKLKKFKIVPSRVIFEIPEEVILDKKSKKIAKIVNKLRVIGFKIAVDNFSVEHSDLSRLFNVELDFIKIDGAFIKSLKTNEHNRVVVKALVSLAKTLGIKSIAKFVEDEESYEIVKECKIDYMQGYFIGKPEQELFY